MPRVPNSARGKRTTRKKKDEMCAFDLLATVAGTLLADQDPYSNHAVKDLNRFVSWSSAGVVKLVS